MAEKAAEITPTATNAAPRIKIRSVAMEGLQDLLSRKLGDERIHGNRMLNHLSNPREASANSEKIRWSSLHYQRKRCTRFSASSHFFIR
jgi:hypothetical protein